MTSVYWPLLLGWVSLHRMRVLAMATVHRQPRERNERGLQTFFEEFKSLFSQLGHANEGSHSIDEETSLEEFIRRLQDAATTLRLLVDHTSDVATRAGNEDLVLIAQNLTSLLRCTNNICKTLSLCHQTTCL